MKYHLNKAVKEQIRNLLLIIFSAVACGFALAGYMLYYYGPTGKYVVKNALLSPDVIESLSANSGQKSGGNTRFILDKIEFSFYNSSKREEQKVSLKPETYAKLYHLLSNDTSLIEVPEETMSLFYRSSPASLILTVRSENKVSAEESSKVFQEVQFASQGDYFRIELRSQNSLTDKWAYFYHPHVYQEALKILTTHP
jgi:hypothetical protein